VDWLTLTDPGNKAGKQTVNPGKDLTGADFDLRAMRRTANKEFWVADASGPSLLHFDRNGRLVEAPIALADNGAVQGLGLLQDGKTLIVAQRGGNGITIRPYDTQAHTLGDTAVMVPLQNGGNVMRGFSMINGSQALIIEEDNRENTGAQFKQLFLVDLGANPATKTQIGNLLNLSDPGSISTADVFTRAADAFGLGNDFKFSFGDISGVYALVAQTVLLVNNNNVPFGQGRSKSKADDTEFIAVTVPQALQMDGAFAAPR
jgi:glycerophosphoryl diester phosphodiesterase